jgi:hypothetical protein
MTDALAQRDAVAAELEANKAEAATAIAEWQAALEAEKERATRALAERDEARTVAKTLHQRLAAQSGASADAFKKEVKELRETLDHERALAAKLVAERDRATQQNEALQRMIEQERSNRVKAVAERDEYKSRFKALTTEIPSRTPSDSGETTQSYMIGRTEPEMPIPAAARAPEPTTDPARPVTKKK